MFEIGSFTFDPHSLILRRQDGTEVPLRRQSLRVLEVLVEARGQPVTRDTLMATVWPDIAVTDDSLVQCIKDIRAALGDKDRRIVRTLIGRGYAIEFAVPAARNPPAPRLFVGLFRALGEAEIADELREELRETLMSRLAHRVGLELLNGDADKETADTLLTGSVRVKNGTASITYQICRVKDSAVRFSHTLSADATDVTNISNVVADSIAAQLRVHMIVHDGADFVEQPDQDLSFEALKSKAAWHMARFKRENWIAARASIMQALKLQPDDPTVLAMSASMATQMAPLIGFDEIRPETDSALSTADRAVELNPAVDYVMRTRGNIRLWLLKDHDGARRDCIRALKLNPVFHLAHFTIAQSEVMAGEIESGISRLEALMARAEFDPQMPLYLSMIALGRLLDGDFENALNASRDAVDLWPTQPWTVMVHAMALAASGRTDDMPAASRWEDLPDSHLRDMAFVRPTDLERLEAYLQAARLGGH